jgi:hypothetical protein
MPPSPSRHATLRAKLKPLAPGLTPRAVLDKLAAIQMLDVHFPTTDGRTLILTRYTELNTDQKLLVKQLKLDLPSQPPPAHHRASRRANARRDAAGVVETFGEVTLILFTFSLQSAKLGYASAH